jgi:GNAT superfamily N-acetyltransferase
MDPNWLELSPADPDPAVSVDRGVSLVPAADRALHAPDRTLLLLDGGSLVGRCSCWWSATPAAPGGRAGLIGHYAAADETSGTNLLSRACGLLAANGCEVAVGPMDGNTWRRYRFVVDRGPEPPFFLEPDNPDEWPRHWEAAGFAPLAHYTSAINDDLARDDPRAGAVEARLADAGVRIRTLDLSRIDDELRRLFSLSLAAFGRNFLYSPIDEREFVVQYSALLPCLRPELVLLAERKQALVAFMLALPDMLQARRPGGIDTVILKTIAVDPSMTGMGLGSALMDRVQRAAREAGFRRAIHALMHEANPSRRISRRSAREFRRYALFARRLPA